MFQIEIAIVELLHKNRAEVIEDVAMKQAIAEGEHSDVVSREAIFQRLDPKEMYL